MTEPPTDLQAVTDALNGYSFTIDQRDWEGLVEVFTADATYDVGAGVVKGNAEIAAMIRGAVAHLEVTQHLNGNQRIRISGDTAQAFSYVSCMQVAPGDRGYWHIGGDYVDEIVRDGDRWRIRNRAFTLRWQLGDPTIMAPAGDQA